MSWRTATLLWRASPACTAAWAALCVLQGLLPLAAVTLTGAFVNSLATASPSSARSSSAPPSPPSSSPPSSSAPSPPGSAPPCELVTPHVAAILHRHSCALDLGFYESSEFHDRLHRARDEAQHRPIALLESAGLIVENGISLLSMAAVLLRFGPWVPAALVFATAPALYVVLRHRLAQHAWNTRVAADRRRAWYYDWLITGFEAAAELRLFDLGPKFESAYQRIRAKLRRERTQLSPRQALAEAAAVPLPSWSPVPPCSG